MKIIYLSLSLLFTLPLITKAQQYEMNSAIDTILYNPNNSDASTRSYLKNISGSTDSIHVERIQNDLALGHQTSFGWGAITYAPSVNSSTISDIYVILQDQEADSTFQLLLFPDLNGGTTEVTMRYYSRSDTSKYLDHTYVFVSEIAATISHDDIDRGFSLDNPYPNPTQGLLKLPYQLPADIQQASLQVINLEGKLITEQLIHSNEEQATLQLGEIPEGMYFVYLIAEGRRITQVKCLVNHP